MNDQWERHVIGGWAGDIDRRIAAVDPSWQLMNAHKDPGDQSVSTSDGSAVFQRKRVFCGHDSCPDELLD